jgi:hypothetical protein
MTQLCHGTPAEAGVLRERVEDREPLWSFDLFQNSVISAVAE